MRCCVDAFFGIAFCLCHVTFSLFMCAVLLGDQCARNCVAAASLGRYKPVARRTLVALSASQHTAKGTVPTFGCRDPRTIDPWWVMPDVLVVAAFELSNPVVLLILMKAND